MHALLYIHKACVALYIMYAVVKVVGGMGQGPATEVSHLKLTSIFFASLV